MDSPSLNGSLKPSGGATAISPTLGQAALLLIESLMHALVEKGVISREEFIETVEGAAEVEHELKLADASPPSDSNGSFLYPLVQAYRKELGR